ncbi:hypothetical protein QYF61_008958 [Mycteria americana]|uniref:Uncharacterized protein n=1 Tax=Mycteria americana TaxID=33587 RepID=A0AAN7NI46_MYCAM|nr:hypothetical protein QYF61_008958 [Mycteria americana]
MRVVRHWNRLPREEATCGGPIPGNIQVIQERNCRPRVILHYTVNSVILMAIATIESSITKPESVIQYSAAEILKHRRKNRQRYKDQLSKRQVNDTLEVSLPAVPWSSPPTHISNLNRAREAKQPQFPQPLLIRLLLQTLHQLRCPSLDTLQHLNVFLVVRGPKLNTVFEMQPHQCRGQGDNHFPSPAGHTISDTSQDAVGLLSHLDTLLAHIQLAIDQYPQVLFLQAAFQPLFPKPVALYGVAVTQVQDLALGLVKPHTIGPSPSIQPVQIPLQSLLTLKQINTPAQLGVICKLTEGALGPLVQIIDKDIKQNWP